MTESMPDRHVTDLDAPASPVCMPPAAHAPSFSPAYGMRATYVMVACHCGWFEQVGYRTKREAQRAHDTHLSKVAEVGR